MSTKKDYDVFTNTKKSSQLRQFLWGLIIIITIEVVVVGGVLFLVMPKEWPLYLILAIVTLLSGYALFGLIFMMKSAHIITVQELIIRLGLRFKGCLPLATVINMEMISSVLPPKVDPIGISLFRQNDCLYCLSRKHDVLRLTLSIPILVKAPELGTNKSKQGLVTTILINADEPELMLNKLKDLIPLRHRGNSVTADTPSPDISSDKLPKNPPDLKLTQTNSKHPYLELRNLSKYYGNYLAVNDLSLEVYSGEIFGFLGANGAGKSTTINMMTGLLRPSQGQVLVQGKDLWEPGEVARRRIGFIPDVPILYERLTAREQLIMIGRLYNLSEELMQEKVDELLNMLELGPWSDQMIATYSLGMKRKVSVAMALLPNPEIVVVDELTNAFDAPTLAKIKKILLNICHQGKTVFMSTHVMDVAEQLCHRVGIIHRGQLMAVGKVDELSQSFKTDGSLEALFLKLISHPSESMVEK